MDIMFIISVRLFFISLIRPSLVMMAMIHYLGKLNRDVRVDINLIILMSTNGDNIISVILVGLDLIVPICIMVILTINYSIT